MFLEDRIPIYAWNKLVKRQLLIDFSVFFVEGYIYEDVWWSYRLFNLVETVYLLLSWCIFMKQIQLLSWLLGKKWRTVYQKL